MSVATKPKKNARYDLKAADRKRNLFIIREDSFNRIDLVSRTPGEDNRG